MERFMLIAVLIALLALSAFFAACEVSFLSISNLRMHSLLEKHAPGSESLARLKAKKRRVIISLLIGNNIANIAASTIATAVAIAVFGEAGIGISVGVMSFLIITFGDIAPKSAATTYSEGIALVCAPLMEVFYILSYPFIIIFEKINQMIPGIYSRPTGIERFTEEEVRTAVKLGAHHQSISQTELSMIENVLAFNDRTVEHGMTPIGRVMMFEADMHIKTALERALTSNYTRFPVTRKGKVIGTVSLHLLSKMAFEHPDVCVGQCTLPPFKIRRDEKLNMAFATMRERGKRIGLIMGEKGEILGIITLEDFLSALMNKPM